MQEARIDAVVRLELDFETGQEFAVLGEAEMPGDSGARTIGADYFRTVGVPLRAGRFFEADDRVGKRSVVLINQSLADRYWPHEKAVGKRLTFSSEPKEQDWWTVVGVVGDVKDFPNSPAAVPAFYWPLTQVPTRQVMLAVRDSGAGMRQFHYNLHVRWSMTNRQGCWSIESPVATSSAENCTLILFGFQWALP